MLTFSLARRRSKASERLPIARERVVADEDTGSGPDEERERVNGLSG